MADWYYKVSGAWKQVNQAFFKSSSAWKEIQEGYIKVGGVWKNFYTAFVATSFTTQTSNTSVTVPSGANAIHIRQAVGGGSSGVNGGKGADIFANMCHTNQLVPSAIYLLSICLLINGANANAV